MTTFVRMATNTQPLPPAAHPKLPPIASAGPGPQLPKPAGMPHLPPMPSPPMRSHHAPLAPRSHNQTSTSRSATVSPQIGGPGPSPTQPNPGHSSQGPLPPLPHAISGHVTPVRQSPSVPQRLSADRAANEHLAENHPRDFKDTTDYRDLAVRLTGADPHLLRQVLRDHWQQCFTGSNFHTAFLLNSLLHQASPDILSRAIQDFGEHMVKAALPQIISHTSAEDLDRAADAILSKVSTAFLDRALARRLETIEARSLVNALARAERLGYDVSDVVEDRNSGRPEHVTPSLQGVTLPTNVPPHQAPWAAGPWPEGPPRPNPHHNPPHQTPGSHEAMYADSSQDTSDGIMYCKDCSRPCSGLKALAYHNNKDSCDRDFRMEDVNRTICAHCGRVFTSAGGLYYHKKSAVCGHYSESSYHTIMARLQEHVIRRDAGARGRAHWQSSQSQPSVPAYTHSTPIRAAIVNHSPKSNVSFHQVTPKMMTTSSPLQDHGDLLAHLNPNTRAKYESDVTETERKYGQWMQEALDLPEPERSERMSKLKNSYNTKQSTTRKKYGIRLRGNRTPEEIEAERRRLLGPKYSYETWQESERTGKKIKSDDGTVTPSRATSNPTSDPAPGFSQEDGPRKRVRLSEMDVLSGAAASVETQDPTTYLKSSQPQGLAQLRETQANAAVHQTKGTPFDPMAVDSDGDADVKENEPRQMKKDDDDDSSSSSDSSTEDIPA